MWRTWGSIAYRFLVWKCKGRSRCRWEGNIRTYLTEIGWEPLNWINLAKARDNGVAVVEPGMNLDYLKCEQFLEFSQGTGVFLRRTVHQRASFFHLLMCGQTREAN